MLNNMLQLQKTNRQGPRMDLQLNELVIGLLYQTGVGFLVNLLHRLEMVFDRSLTFAVSSAHLFNVSNQFGARSDGCLSSSFKACESNTTWPVSIDVCIIFIFKIFDRTDRRITILSNSCVNL